MIQRLRRVLTLGVGLVVVLSGLTACGQKMMATPVIFDGARIDPFSAIPESRRSNEVTVFYATNRPASGEKDNRRYGNGVSEDVALGTVTVRLGSKGMSWEDLYEASTSAKRKRSVPLNLENAHELAVLRATDSLISPPADVRAYTDRINDEIARQRWKDITIYVHGANVDFKKTSCTAGEFHHFMGRHGVMMTFDWPSTQSPITYGTDVKRAAASVDDLARFIELLAENTNAEKINVIGYSSGAQVLSPALYKLREKYASLSEKEIEAKLRIGEVYFAAPDIGLHTFVVNHVPRFHDMAVSTTVTMNLNDSVLSLAQFKHGESRAGRPDIRELNEEETLMVVELVNRPTINVIDMGTSHPPTKANVRGHGYWYKSPWVSADIIIQFIFHASPAERGLLIDDDDARKAEVWYYPADYPERVISRVQAYLASLDKEKAVQEALGRPAQP